MLKFDVAIIGGGPGGSTLASLLRKYTKLSVGVFEREKFPRDHVGESQLPPISMVLNEMGCWDEVERANFPIKVGATYKWGNTDDLWNFEFIVASMFKNEPRPARYAGQRQSTAFQVDRSVYDDILLKHAAKLGAKVFQETGIRTVNRDGDRVTSLVTDGGEEIQAKYYIDASGHVGILRRAMGVEVESPTSLQNIAVWDYWQNADWAVKIGVGGTRVQVMSLGYGWIWFIPLGPIRTSVGLILPAKYYKESGKTPAELYAIALEEEPNIRELMKNAVSEGVLQATKDWSFIADRMAGENWFLVGESAGFADPILAAGLTLTHWSAREAAYTINELEKGRHEPEWLRAEYESLQKRRIWQHIRFADFWYSANGCFTDLIDYTQEIARDAGLDLDPAAAFQWLGTGGFVNEHLGYASAGAFDVRAIKVFQQEICNTPTEWSVAKYNVFTLDTEGAEHQERAHYEKGSVEKVRCLVRNNKILPLMGYFQVVMRALKWDPTLPKIIENFEVLRGTKRPDIPTYEWRVLCLQVLEAMIAERWVTPSLDPSLPMLDAWQDPLAMANLK